MFLKLFRIKTNLTITIVVIVSFFQCSLVSANNTKIGFLLDDISIERWASDQKYLQISAKDQGYELLIGNAFNDQQKQIEQANEMIKAGVKVLIVVAVDAYKAVRIVENAHASGVKVIAYDRLIMNCNLDAYISYDNEMIGVIMAEYITMRKPKGNFAYIGGPKSDRNSLLIRKGIMGYLKPFIDDKSITFVCDTFTQNWIVEDAYLIFKKYLESGKQIPDVVFAGNDQLALGIINVLDNKGLTEKVLVTGQDAELTACRNIVNGRQTLTIFKPTRTLADRAILLTSWLLGEIVFDIDDKINNGKFNVPYFKLFPVPVDRRNMRTSVIMDQFHTEDEIYKDEKN